MKVVKKRSQSKRQKMFEGIATIEKKPRWGRVFLAFMVVIGIGFGIKLILDKTVFYNPLVGTWRGQTAMGIREVVFERDSMTSFGTKTPVKYDIKEKEVIVMDTSLQLGNAYVLIDENTISSKMGNVKTTFKRVK